MSTWKQRYNLSRALLEVVGESPASSMPDGLDEKAFKSEYTKMDDEIPADELQKIWLEYKELGKDQIKP